jgi:hypothetical protein
MGRVLHVHRHLLFFATGVDLFIVFYKVMRRRLADVGGKFGGSKGL